jgi:hypothetical protein
MWRESRPVLTPFAHAFDFVFDFAFHCNNEDPTLKLPLRRRLKQVPHR